MKNVHIIAASRVATHALRPNVERIMRVLGHPDAWVSDESQLGDFLSPLDRPMLRRAREPGPLSDDLARLAARLERRGKTGPWKMIPASAEVAAENAALLAQWSEALEMPLTRELRIIELAHMLRERKRA